MAHKFVRDNDPNWVYSVLFEIVKRFDKVIQ